MEIKEDKAIPNTIAYNLQDIRPNCVGWLMEINVKYLVYNPFPF